MASYGRSYGATKKSGGSPSFLSTLIPDFIEKPAGKLLGFEAGLLKNLLGDVKDTVIGLPAGLVQMGKHPIRSLEQIKTGYWQQYSPLFRGDFATFGKNLYDHPLGPALDVLAVFSGGAAAAVKGGSFAAKAGVGGARVQKLAAMNRPKSLVLPDPKGLRKDQYLHYSTRPSRRVMQEANEAFEGWLSRRSSRAAWVVDKRMNARYERRHLVDVMHRAVVKNTEKSRAVAASGEAEAARLAAEASLREAADAYVEGSLGMTAIVELAHGLEDVTEHGRLLRRGVTEDIHTNMIRNTHAYEPTKAAALVQGGHIGYLKAPEYLNTQTVGRIRNAEAKHSRTVRRYGKQKEKIKARLERRNAERSRLAEMADPDKIRTQLDEANAELRRLMDEGHLVQGGATYRAGARRGEVIVDPNTKQLMRYETEQLYEQQQLVKRLEGQYERARWNKDRLETLHGKIDEDMQRLARQEQDLIDQYAALERMKDEATDLHFAEASGSHEAYVKYMDDIGHKALTKDPTQALRTPDGRLYVMNKTDAFMLAREAGRTNVLLHNIVHKPTLFWKRMVLGYTPRIITNNAVGNWMLYMAQEGSGGGLYGMLHAIKWRASPGERMRWTKRKLMDAETQIFPTNHWLHKFFSDELADAWAVDMEIAIGATGKTPWKHRLKQGAYPATKAVAEDPVRAATIIRALQREPEFQALVKRYKQKGLSHGKALDAAANRLLNADSKVANGVIRDRVALESRRLAGDYVTLNEAERWLRDFIPFYLWNRHILKTTGNMLMNQPERVLALAQVGQMGTETMDELFGELPTFLRGAIPMSMLGFGSETATRQRMLVTASLNPFATLGEFSEAVTAFTVGGEHRGAVFNQLNPYFTAAVESATERSLLTGQFSPRTGGVAEDILNRILESFPHLRYASQHLEGDTFTTRSGGQAMLRRGDLETTLSSLLGVPLREANVDVAAAVRRLQLKQSKPKGRYAR